MAIQGIDVTTIILTYRRDEALSQTLSKLVEYVGSNLGHLLVLVDNNADGKDRSTYLNGFLNHRYVNMASNSGVTGGRNAGIKATEGDIVVFVDDDVLVEAPDNFYALLIDEFATNPELGAVAFRSVVGKERISDPKEFPHTNKAIPRGTKFETFRYIGVGHAFRKTALDEIGLYRDDFFYGMEEFDMSFRLMKKGWKIVYDPRFLVHHLKEESGRLPSSHILERMYSNKLKVAWLHLPAPLAFTCLLAWTIKTIQDTRSILAPLRAVGPFLKWAWQNRGSREPSREVVNRIRALGGQAWK